jgi:PadR family transcriptional regulator, regulatory protein PadR
MSEGEQEQEPGGDRGPKRFGEADPRPRNFLVPVILLTLREWNSYGYELLERMAALGFETINPGTLYRTLRQMEKEGLCESKWETSRGGPARRMYSITDIGEAYLELWAEALEQYRSTLDNFFRLYTGRRQRTSEEEDR